jgi:NADP-dependent 3-hydroxy acid dehydrogenase YdfG
MTNDQYTFTNPVTRYPKLDPKPQHQTGPGSSDEMSPTPDIGVESYRGTGRLNGRKALVTGADSGIGAAVAIAFAREGADVAMSYLPDEEDDARAVVAQIEAAGRKAVALPGNLTDESYCRSLVEDAVAGLGGLDIVVNNAGKQQAVEKFEDLEPGQFDETFKTNVYAMFWVSQAALPHLLPGSTIINTTSVQAYNPSPILVDYASTKATINTFTKALAGSWRPAASESMQSLRGRSGHRYRSPAASLRRSFPISVTRRRSGAQGNRPNSRRPTCSSPRVSRAM